MEMVINQNMKVTNYCIFVPKHLQNYTAPFKRFLRSQLQRINESKATTVVFFFLGAVLFLNHYNSRKEW